MQTTLRKQMKVLIADLPIVRLTIKQRVRIFQVVRRVMFMLNTKDALDKLDSANSTATAEPDSTSAASATPPKKKTSSGGS